MSDLRGLVDRWLNTLASLDVPALVGLMADDAVLEFPFAPAGLPTRLEGKATIEPFLAESQVFSALQFNDIEIHSTSDPEMAIVECGSTATVKADGSDYDNRYVMVLRARAGSVVLYREYFNPLPLMALFAP